MSSITDNNLDFWITNNYNVCFRGKAGAGKTATVIDAFTRKGLKWLYFSASTMDPWVDFIGVPREVKDPNGNTYLDLVRPKTFADDEVEAIFLDEFNRAPKKIRNAVMELIQFKSINGKKFNNLKIVWTAINPSEDDGQKYDVEELDPAQLDRFHIIADFPYTPVAPYFRKKYGTEKADAAISWWKDLSKEQKNIVSPRRLDYTLDVYSKGGDITFVLPNSVNTNKLLQELKHGPIGKNLEKLFSKKDMPGSILFLKDENNYNGSVSYILTEKGYLEFFVPLLEKEKTISLMGKDKRVAEFIFSNYKENKVLITELSTSNTSSLSKKAKEVIDLMTTQSELAAGKIPSAINRTFNKKQNMGNFIYNVQKAERRYSIGDNELNYTTQAKRMYLSLVKDMPEVIDKSLPQTDHKKLFNHLVHILQSFQPYSIKKYAPDIEGLINNVFINYINNYGDPTLYNNLPTNLIDKKTLLKKAPGLFIP